MSRLGIIAGKGQLPLTLIEACQEQDRDFMLVAFEGQTEAELVEGRPHFWTRFGAIGKTLKRLKSEGVDQIVMAGSMRRPSFWEMRPDFKAIKILIRLGMSYFGDDQLLRSLAGILEEEGIEVVGAHEVASDLLAPEGIVGRYEPKKDHLSDIELGVETSQELGRMDVGQACVVQQNVVLGLESVEGTAALIERCSTLKEKGRGPILVKTKKPQQDERLDMPAIGPETIEQAHQAGLEGIVVQSGGCILLERAELVRLANKYKIFVLGVEV